MSPIQTTPPRWPSIAWGGQLESVAVSGKYAFVAGGRALNVVDISNPDRLAEAGYYPLNGWLYRVRVVDGLVYVVCNWGPGLVVFWHAPSTWAAIPTSGGSLISTFDTTTYLFPTGTFTEAVRVKHQPRYPGNIPLPADLASIGHAFEVAAVYTSTMQPAPPRSARLILSVYDMRMAKRGRPLSTRLRSIPGMAASGSRRSVARRMRRAHTVTAVPDHLGLFAVLGQTQRLFLPLVRRR